MKYLFRKFYIQSYIKFKLSQYLTIKFKNSFLKCLIYKILKASLKKKSCTVHLCDSSTLT